MFARARRQTIAHRSLGRQRGVILLLIVLSMLAIVGVIFLGGLSQSAGQRAQVQQVSGAQTLVAAKQALIGYAVSRILPVTNGRLGRLPQPDTLGTNGKYDGVSDNTSCLDGNAVNGMPALSLAPAAQVANLRCVGRLPWSDLGLSIDGASDYDVLGLVPWYAVSPNFADPTAGNGECVTVLNAGTMASSPTMFNCPIDTAPAWPWMKICDAAGKIVSKRVAFVLILPGEALATTGRTQVRAITAAGNNPNGYGNPSDFLDALPTPAGWASLPVDERCSTFDNANLSGEFIMADRSTVFNDQLLYVTVDELMVEIEKRVALEMREALTSVRSLSASYPWMAPFTVPTLTTTSFTGQALSTTGLVPFHDYTNNANRFMTELAWSIGGVAADHTGTFTGNLLTTETQFPCGGGVNAVCICRARVATTATAIPRTLNAAAFEAHLVDPTGITTPAVACKRDADPTAMTRNRALTCDAHTYTVSTTSVTYAIQRRDNLVLGLPIGDCLTTGTRINIGNFTGTATRTVTVSPIAFSGTVTGVSGTAATHASRTITNPSAPSASFLEVVHKWVPTSLGSIPFDQFASTFPTGMTTGFGQTAATTAITFSKVRLYPDVPAWYATNKWYEFIAAAFSPDIAPASNLTACGVNCLISGSRTNIELVVIATGAPLGGQTRYSGSPTAADFLELSNTTGASTRSFASSTQPRTATYADSIVTIPK